MIIVTGCAGFIGYSLCKSLLNNNKSIIGIDSIDNYYDTRIKNKRLVDLNKHKKKFKFIKINLSDEKKLKKINSIFSKTKIIIHLAAQPGVNLSFKKPNKYFLSNVLSFQNILEICRNNKIKLIYASSSSVYGKDAKIPFSEENIGKLDSYYASTKRMNEIQANSYNKFFEVQCVGLRFFTVYGPHGRPDMSVYKFTKKIIKNETLELYNKGNNLRDFTYIDDVTYVVNQIINKFLKNKFKIYKVNDPSSSVNIYNICNKKIYKVQNVLKQIESFLNKKAKAKLINAIKGDLKLTFGSNKKLKKQKIKFKITTLFDGLKKFVFWYKNK